MTTQRLHDVSIGPIRTGKGPTKISKLTRVGYREKEGPMT
jgi:hypothetical protein